MKILSPITKHNIGSKNLKKSLIKYGYDFHFIGLGEKWRGFMTKIQIISKYLETADDDIYCIIDGYDMLACNYPEKLIEKYNKIGSSIVFGGEKFCFSYNGIPIQKYKNVSFINSRKYLNSGFYIGKKNDLLHMCNWAIKNSIKNRINDDQKILCLYSNTFPNKVSVDLYQTMVFNTITEIDVNSYELKHDTIYIKPFSQTPCFIHFPSIRSDGFKRYNKYGRSILKNNFSPLYGEKTWNVLSNIPLYLILLTSIYFLFYYFYRLSGIVILTLFLIIYIRIYI